MRINRFLTAVALLAISLAVASCTDRSPTAPTASLAAPDSSAELLELLTPTLRRVGLLTCRPLPAASTQAQIGPDGGTIRVGPHRLVIPRGALDSAVTITASAPTGTINRVELLPHGLVFELPATLDMSYANCDLLSSLLPKRIAYVNGRLTILSYLLSVDDLLQQRVKGRLDHFSDYVVAW